MYNQLNSLHYCLSVKFQEGVLRAGGALALFAFNNPKQQQLIREAGGIHMSVYQNFLNSKNEVDQANAAFQVFFQANEFQSQLDEHTPKVPTI